MKCTVHGKIGTTMVVTVKLGTNQKKVKKGTNRKHDIICKLLIFIN